GRPRSQPVHDHPRPVGQSFQRPCKRFCHKVARRCYDNPRAGGVRHLGNGPTDSMSFANPYLDNDFLTAGVITRRCVAWVFDVFLIAMLVWALWWILVM